MHAQTNTPVYQTQLAELGLISNETTVEHWPRTRDSDIPVLRDTISGVIFLKSQPNLTQHYKSKTIGRKEKAEVLTSEGLLLLKRNNDLQRRFEQTKHLIANRSVCDFGTGRGLFLDLALQSAASVAGIEIRQDLIELIQSRLGTNVDLFTSFEFSKDTFDVVTLFHVLEHIPDQTNVLRTVYDNLRSGGKIFVEVPHARDFLSEDLSLSGYRDFIYWSEHLVLHTRQSLERFLSNAGFEDIQITGFQRYGLANHLYWLRHGKPGGHEHFAHLTTDDAENAYCRGLSDRDRTDTLIAVAQKP